MLVSQSICSVPVHLVPWPEQPCFEASHQVSTLRRNHLISMSDVLPPLYLTAWALLVASSPKPIRPLCFISSWMRAQMRRLTPRMLFTFKMAMPSNLPPTCSCICLQVLDQTASKKHLPSNLYQGSREVYIDMYHKNIDMYHNRKYISSQSVNIIWNLKMFSI